MSRAKRRRDPEFAFSMRRPAPARGASRHTRSVRSRRPRSCAGTHLHHHAQDGARVRDAALERLWCIQRQCTRRPQKASQVSYSSSQILLECFNCRLASIPRRDFVNTSVIAVTILLPMVASSVESLPPQSLRTTAHDYYEWRKREFPVAASDQGFHAYDDRLTDNSPAAIAR